MYFLNLSLLQFIAVFGSVSAVAVALYLLDRSRRKQVVSTLRFWVSAEQPAVAARRRRINQPWSLILQLASMALLLLAIAQLRLGSPAQAGRDHVIIVETSAWMAARSGNRTLMDLARERARRYLQALPSRDRAMIVRADALTTPATGFEPDRRKAEAAILASEPGSTALNLDQALAFSRHIQAAAAGRAGEIVFVGSGRTAERDPSAPAPPKNLRALLVADSVENAGLRRVGMRRSAADPDLWQIYVSARNYGTKPKQVSLSIDFGPPGTAGRVPAGTQQVVLAPGAEKEIGFEYRTRAAGILGVTLLPRDTFPADDHAELELPSQPSLPVVVYSDEPDLLRPILSATPRLNTVYRKPQEYRPDDRGLVILDRFIPPQRPAADSIWIDPPAAGSPVPVRRTVDQAAFKGWAAGHPASAGLRAKDFKLEKATVFEAPPSDSLGSVDAGPVIVARQSSPRIVAFGFHPALSAMRYELTTPLLFANLLRWVSPEIFRRWEITGGSVGAIRLPLDTEVPAGQIKVTAEDGTALPFTVRDRTLDFFAGTPGAVQSGGRRSRIRLLPDSAAAWGLQVGAPRRSRQGHPALRPLARWFERHLAVARGPRRPRPGGGVVPLRPLPAFPLSNRTDAAAAEIARGHGGAAMTFDHPWLLLLVLLPVAWAVWEWRFSGRRASLLLKAAAFAAIALALASPRLTVYESKVAVAILADTSASVSSQDLQTESALADRIERARGRHWTRIMPFARSTRVASVDERVNRNWRLRHTAGNAGHGTNLEAAIRDGAAALPAGLVPRLLLVSDGNENLGSVSRAIWQAQQLGIPVDTVPLPGRPKPGLVLESVTFPGQVFSGERFPIEISLSSPRAAEAAVEMTAEGKSIGKNQVDLAAGQNRLRLQASVNSVGAIALAGKISAEGLGDARFEDAVTLRNPRVLLVSRDPAASEQHLIRALQANQFEVEQVANGVPDKLDKYQLAVINNWDMESIPLARKTALESFVKQGGGLVWIAGEHNIYVDKKGREEDALERTLPAKMAPPRSPEGTCVVLIVDKSSSMEGRKMELARVAAAGVIENLRPIDSVGVLIFDNSFQWAVPIRKADDRPAIKRIISGITPDGGTQIAPALAEGYARILPASGDLPPHRAAHRRYLGRRRQHGARARSRRE